MYVSLHVKYLVFSPDFNEIWNSTTEFRKKKQPNINTLTPEVNPSARRLNKSFDVKGLMKIRPVAVVQISAYCWFFLTRQIMHGMNTNYLLRQFDVCTVHCWVVHRKANTLHWVSSSIYFWCSSYMFRHLRAILRESLCPCEYVKTRQLSMVSKIYKRV
jgi:hypothetical protein